MVSRILNNRMKRGKPHYVQSHRSQSKSMWITAGKSSRLRLALLIFQGRCRKRSSLIKRSKKLWRDHMPTSLLRSKQGVKQPNKQNLTKKLILSRLAYVRLGQLTPSNFSNQVRLKACLTSIETLVLSTIWSRIVTLTSLLLCAVFRKQLRTKKPKLCLRSRRRSFKNTSSKSCSSLKMLMSRTAGQTKPCSIKINETQGQKSPQNQRSSCLLHKGHMRMTSVLRTLKKRKYGTD